MVARSTAAKAGRDRMLLATVAPGIETLVRKSSVNCVRDSELKRSLMWRTARLTGSNSLRPCIIARQDSRRSGVSRCTSIRMRRTSVPDMKLYVIRLTTDSVHDMVSKLNFIHVEVTDPPLSQFVS